MITFATSPCPGEYRFVGQRCPSSNGGGQENFASNFFLDEITHL